jgi:LmbE family N-acetylglucosaminyl deacetylase
MAHPDDTEILVGGTLFQLKALGWELGILTMTAGDCGSSTTPREEIARIRYGEAQAAAKFLGATYICTGLMDVEVFANAENLRRVIDCMRQFDPDVVITHSPVDYMLDHEEASRLVRGASFALAMPNYETRHGPPAKTSRATPALYYADAIEGKNPMGERIYPQFYVDITRQLDNKREMLSRHASQREWLRAHHGMDEYLDRMTAWAAAYGGECGVAHAEGFRQHLGHGYPQEPILQNALAQYLHVRGGHWPDLVNKRVSQLRVTLNYENIGTLSRVRERR